MSKRTEEKKIYFLYDLYCDSSKKLFKELDNRLQLFISVNSNTKNFSRAFKNKNQEEIKELLIPNIQQRVKMLFFHNSREFEHMRTSDDRRRKKNHIAGKTVHPLDEAEAKFLNNIKLQSVKYYFMFEFKKMFEKIEIKASQEFLADLTSAVLNIEEISVNGFKRHKSESKKYKSSWFSPNFLDLQD